MFKYLSVFMILLSSMMIEGFLSTKSYVKVNTNKPTILASSSSSATTTEESKKKKNTATLTFDCTGTFVSEPVTKKSDDAMLEFFRKTNIRNCMVSAGNQRPVKEIDNPSDALLEEWKEKCNDVDAAEPNDEDKILRVKTGGFNFPGLSVSSNALIGSKLVLVGEGGNKYPTYEFTLIKDERQVSGLAPIVFIFNKLTGGNKSSNTSATSLSRVTVVDAPSDKLMFQSDVDFTIQISIPKAFLRILPVTQEKAEAQGSEAILKTLEKDVQNGVMKELYKLYTN